MQPPRPRRFAVPTVRSTHVLRALLALAAPAALGLGLIAGRALADSATEGDRPRTAARAGGAPARRAPRAVHAQAPVASGPAYALPTLNHFGRDDVCESWIAVQNVGNRPAQPVVAYVRVGVGPAEETRFPGRRMTDMAAGVACGGLLRPGGHWNFFGAQVATGSRSGIVLSLDGATLTAAGADAALGDDTIGDRLCFLLADRVDGDPNRWAAFLAAWQSGAAWEGLPLGRVAGPPLEVRVHRSCPGQQSPGSDTTSAYRAPRVVPSAAAGHRAVTAPVVRPTGAEPWPQGGHVYAQNTGALTGAFQIAYQAENACAPSGTAQTLVLRPAEAAPFDLTLAPPGWRGQVVVTGTSPFALVNEPADADWITTDAVASAPVADSIGDDRLLAAVLPLAPGRFRIAFDLVNNGRTAFSPRARVLGPRGMDGPVLTALANGPALCPGGHVSAGVEVVVDLSDGPGGWLAWIDGPGADGGSVAATVMVSGLDDAGQPKALGLYSVAAAPVSEATTRDNVRALALPSSLDDLHNSGIAHAIGVARAGPNGGRWDYVVQLYDRNGLVRRLCRTVDDGVTDIVVLDAVPGVPDGLKASAVVGLTGWGGDGAPGDLIATALWTKGTAFGADVPGDEWAAVEAASLDAAWSQSVAAAPCGAAVEPAPLPGQLTTPALRAAAFAPVLTYIGQDDLCSAALTVTNRGQLPAQIVRILFGEPGFCSPDCAPPLAVRCTPLIAPGASFTFTEPRIGTKGFVGGVTLSLDGRSLAELGLGLGDNRTAAQVLCASPRLTDSCAGWRQFWLAWQAGAAFDGLPLAHVVGPAITVEVERSCSGNDRVAGTARYTAPSAAVALVAETQPDRFVYSVDDLSVPVDDTPGLLNGFGPILYLQNAGPRCAGITAEFLSATAPPRRCDITTLSPGETYQLDVIDCTHDPRPGPVAPWRGTVVLTSEQPLAIVVDRHTNPLSTGPVVRGALPAPTADPNATATPTNTALPTTATATPTGTLAPTQAPTSTPPPTVGVQERLFLPRLLRQPRP